MSGKIFAESANLYQDQAKILFEYYCEAAERIVSAEERIEKDIAIASEYKTQLDSEIAKVNLLKMVCFAVAGVLLGAFIFLIISQSSTLLLTISVIGVLAAAGFGLKQLLSQNNFVREQAATEIKISGFQQLHRDIFRDYKVSKLGVGYVPVAGQIAFEDKSFLIDYTGSKNNESFVLQTLRQSDLFTTKISELEALLKEVPMVENSNETEVVDTDQYSTSIQKVVYHDYFGKLDRNLRTSAYCMEDLDVTSVSLPVILPESDYAKYLDEHSTSNPGKGPLFKPFDTAKFEDDIDRFHALNEMKKSLERHSVQFEDVLKNLMVNMANSVQAITKLKVSTTSRLIDQSNRLLYKILKVSYNHYSPLLEAEEIERIRLESFDFSESVEKYEPFHLKQSSRVRYDLMSESWVAEDGSKTNFPFGMHQIHEEIVAPMVQSLMQETRLERFKIYNNIKDQKISYLNKWHQDTEDFYGRNRTESNDLINIMRSTLSEYIAAYNTLSALQNTEKSMTENESLDSTVVESKNNSAEVFAAFNLKSQDFQHIQTEFAEYMERLKNDIELRAAKFEHVEYYDASLRDSSPKNMATATNRMHDLEPRRKQLIAVNPFYAETSELPPEPNIEDITYEHMSINLSAVARAALNDLNDGLEQPLDSAEEDLIFNKSNTGTTPAASNEVEKMAATENMTPEQPPAENGPDAFARKQGATVVEEPESPVDTALFKEETINPEVEENVVIVGEKPMVPLNAEPGSPIAEEPTTPVAEEQIVPVNIEPLTPFIEVQGMPVFEEQLPPVNIEPIAPFVKEEPATTVNAEIIAERYTTLFGNEFTNQVVFVSAININVGTGYDGVQIACEEKAALESSLTFRELVSMDKSGIKQLAWMELREDDIILYTIKILLK